MSTDPYRSSKPMPDIPKPSLPSRVHRWVRDNVLPVFVILGGVLVVGALSEMATRHRLAPPPKSCADHVHVIVTSSGETAACNPGERLAIEPFDEDHRIIRCSCGPAPQQPTDAGAE